MKRVLISALVLFALILSTVPAAAGGNQVVGVNVVLNTDITKILLADLGKLGKVRDVVYEIDALTMQIKANDLAAIQALPYVAVANLDAERTGSPVDTVAVSDFMWGFGTWDLDVINVTNPGPNNRQVAYDGDGVYVAVLDTGLVDSWRQYIPQERIASQFAKAFGGGGGDVGTISEQPNKWEHDQSSHGTHVTSTILGYQFGVNTINGVAPLATVIPVKVLNQNGSGWSSVIARGITYVTDLKLSGELGTSSVVINMSLGGSRLDAMEKAAIDYAVDNGVIIVASAGNRGIAGMGYPGAYEPVISVGASGWLGEWDPLHLSNWWYSLNDPEPNNMDYYYMTDFSSRALTGQDLDVVAPGSWVLGPYQMNSGQTSYYFLGGTSMASPHVAGIVALMIQKDPSLSASEAETILTGAALPFLAGCRNVYQPWGTSEEFCWEADATGSGLITADAALDATP